MVFSIIVQGLAIGPSVKFAGKKKSKRFKYSSV